MPSQMELATSAKEVMLFVWSVCLSDCLSVCLWAGLLKK